MEAKATCMKLRKASTVFLNILFLASYLTSIYVTPVYATSATTITTAVANTASNWDPQRKLFAVNESGTVYTFAFFANSSGGYCSSSTDGGSTWSNPALFISTIMSGNAFSVRYRNYNSIDYVYVVWTTNLAGVPSELDFVRCTISGSTLTLGIIYQVLTSQSERYICHPDVECATDGRVIVCYSYGQATSPWLLSVGLSNNANNNGSGSWSLTTQTYKLGVSNTNNVWVGLTRLSDTNGTGKVYCAYAGDDLSALKGTLWNGSTWGTVETITTDSLGAQFFSLGSYGNSIYVMFINTTATCNPVFNTRSLNNPFWGTESKASSDAVGAVSICINQTTGDVWGIWGNNINTAIDYAQYNGTWQSTKTLYNASAGYSINPPSVMTYYDVVNNNVGVMWCESHATDCYLKYLGLSVVPTADVTSPTWSGVSYAGAPGTPSYNSTSAGAPCVLTCLWRDDANASGFIEGNNNTGTWVNTTWSSAWSNWADSESAWANVTLTLNTTYNYVIQYEFWANDTSNNWNNTGIWTLTTSATLVDSNPTANAYETLIYARHPSNVGGIFSDVGQSFSTLSPSYNITSVTFVGEKAGNPTGIAYAVLYAHGGVYGNSSVPTGPPLATSNGFDMSTFPNSWANITFTFNSSQQYTLQPNTHYCIDLQNPSSGTIDSSNLVYWRTNIGFASPDPTHSGNLFTYDAAGWIGYAEGDLGFYVYGVSASPPPPLSNVFELFLFIALGVMFACIFAYLISRANRKTEEPAHETERQGAET